MIKKECQNTSTRCCKFNIFRAGSCFFDMLPVWNSLTVWSELSRWVVFTIYRETQGALLFRKDGVDFPWDIPPSTSGRFRREIRVKYDLFLPNNPYLVFFKRLWRIFTGKFDKIFTWKRVKVVNFGLERGGGTVCLQRYVNTSQDFTFHLSPHGTWHDWFSANS